MILALSFRATAGDPGPSLLRRLPAAGEAAGIDLVLAGYGPRRGPELDPLSVVSTLAGVTHAVGLGAVIRTSAWAPYNVARALAALDHLSGGRAAWLADPGGDPADRFAEHVAVTEALLDSWGSDAMVYDKADSRLVDHTRVRRIRHSGPWFSVDGPANAPRSPQGRPLRLALAGAPGVAADLLVGSEPMGEPSRFLLDLPFSLTGAGPDRRDDAAGLAGLMATHLEAGQCAGFNLIPADPLSDTAAFAAEVSPRLKDRGLAPLRPAAPLRQRLGLEPAADAA